MKFIAVLLIPLTSFASIFFISGSDYSSRSTGLRNSDFAVNSYHSCSITNPSFLAEQKEIYLTSSYYNYFKDINSGNITLLIPGLFAPANVPLAISFSTVSYGTFENVELGTDYSPYEIMFVLSSGYKLNDVSAGINLKYIFSSINSDYSSSGIITDITGLYKFNMEKASIALGIFNLGVQIENYNGKDEDLDTYLKSGAGYRLEKLPLKLMIQNDLYFDGKIRNAAGIEFAAKQNLIVRAGYEFSGKDMNIGTNTKSEQFSGMSLGATILLEDLGFDFSYSINGGIENEFAMTINMNLEDYIK